LGAFGGVLGGGCHLLRWLVKKPWNGANRRLCSPEFQFLVLAVLVALVLMYC
jgi:hypothetical protein